jgi:hypothetical protein
MVLEEAGIVAEDESGISSITQQAEEAATGGGEEEEAAGTCTWKIVGGIRCVYIYRFIVNLILNTICQHLPRMDFNFELGIETQEEHHRDVSSGVTTCNDYGEDVLTMTNHGIVARSDQDSWTACR